jgi:hypothetical protein
LLLQLSRHSHQHPYQLLDASCHPQRQALAIPLTHLLLLLLLLLLVQLHRRFSCF